jgi:cell division protein FtsZ
MSKAERVVQMGVQVTEGLGAGSQPEVGRAAAEEAIDEIRDHLSGAHMVFVTAGMGGGTGTGAAPVVAKVARELGILTVGVVTKPFQFEGARRMRFAEAGIVELQKHVDTQLIIPNQNLFRVANEKTTFADAFAMADQVLYSGVACITDLMVKEGLINLDFADVRAVMKEMGKAMMGTGEASGEKRAITAAEAAISNPLIDDASMKGAKGLLVSITGGKDLTLYEVDEAATRIRGEVDQDANIIVGATFDESLEGIIRVSVVATGIDNAGQAQRPTPAEARAAEITSKIRGETRRTAERVAREPQPAPAVADAAHAAVAAAILPAAIEDVSIRPMPMKPSLFEAPQEEVQPEPALPKAFIPPAAERPMAPVRMPRIEDLPLPAQNEIKAQRGELAADHPEKRRMSLMQRLASVGLGRKDEAPQPPQTAHQPVPVAKRPVRPAPRPPEARQEPVSEYARRPAPQGLDPHGRPAAVHSPSEDDQLEIPAFLRRQAN